MLVPTEKPSVIYPVGAKLEDEKMIMEVLEFQDKPLVHMYKVKVLKWKISPAHYITPHMNMDTPWIIVVPDSIPKIKVL